MRIKQIDEEREKIKGYLDELKQPMAQLLVMVRDSADKEEWMKKIDEMFIRLHAEIGKLADDIYISKRFESLTIDEIEYLKKRLGGKK